MKGLVIGRIRHSPEPVISGFTGLSRNSERGKFHEEENREPRSESARITQAVCERAV
jgi:hypothetical protein